MPSGVALLGLALIIVGVGVWQALTTHHAYLRSGGGEL